MSAVPQIDTTVRVLRVYVAGSSLEIPRVRAVMLAVLEAGHEVAFDWTLEHRPAAALTIDERRAAAARCCNAIDRSDVLLLLAPTQRSDALWEAGYAQGCQACGQGPGYVLVSGPVEARGIFAAHCEEAESDTEALLVLRSWAGDDEARAALEARSATEGPRRA